MERLPLRDQPALKPLSPQYQIWLEHSSYDSYWKSVDVIARADQITAKVLGVTGWWDNFLGGHLALYRALRDRSPAGHHQRLVIGPWDHFTYVGVVPTAAGAWNFGPAGVAGPVVTEPLALAWFGRWLGDEPESELTGAGTKWYAVGGGGWRTTDAWPPSATAVSFYLHGGGLLSTEPAEQQTADLYDYDPRNPTPTVGGRTLMPTVVTAGIQDQQDATTRADVLVYDTPPLSSPVEIAGNVRVALWAASSAVDTDFAAILIDVAPDGRRWLVADGIVRARHRNGFHQEEYLTPGEPTRFDVDLWDVAWTFEAGHRIGLHLSSASFPRFDRNLNVEISAGTGSLAEAQVAHQQVFHDATHLSALVLPVVSGVNRKAAR
jgi:hypothetical protein